MRGIVGGSTSSPRLLTAALVTLMIFAAGDSSAAVTTSPPSATVVAGQVSPPISLTLTFPPDPFGGITGATVIFAGLPAGASTIPSPIMVSAPPGVGTASTSFSIATSISSPPGIHPISITTSPDIGAGTGMFVLVIPAPSFDTFIAPNPVTMPWGGSASVTVSTTPNFGFASDITYAFAGFPSGITAGGNRVVSPPYVPAGFAFTVAAGTPPGVHTGSLVATWLAPGPQTRSFPMTVIVQRPTLAASFSPPTVSIIDGGPSVEGTLSLTPGAGYAGSPTLVWGPIPPGLEVTPLALPSPALPPAQSTPVSIRARGAVPGVYTLSTRVTDPAATVDVTAMLVVTVAPPPDATLTVSPPAISVIAGRSASVTVGATGINGFAGTLSVTSPSLVSIVFSPATFSLRAGESREVAVQAAPTAAPGTLFGSFSATSPDLSGTRSAMLVLTVLHQPPEITSATPPALTAGTIGVPIRLTGTNFRPGAIVTITPAGPAVTSTIVSSATLAEVVVTTPIETTTGRYRIDLRNPDGGTTANGALVIVCPPSSLGAPLSVPTAAIVFPRPYTAVANGENVFPRAVLATTGIGTVIGTWRLDGAAFDQFVVPVSGGLPVEVKAKIPIPVATHGEHRLELAIEQPQRLVTEPVPIIVSVESNSGLQIFDPADGAEVRLDGGTRFRWSIVPGATGYEVEIVAASQERPLLIRLSDSRWSPDAGTLARFGPGRHRWRVAAVFPGEVRGEPAPWRTFVIPGPAASANPSGRAEMPSAASSPYHLASLRQSSLEDSLQELQDDAIAPESANEPALPHEWEYTLLGSATATDEDVPSLSDAARIQLTTTGDLEETTWVTKWTGDLSGRKDLDPEYDTEPESRAWQIESGAIQSRSREELRAGYSPPEFLDQSEFLAAGLARGGALGKVATPLGSISLYDTFHDDAAGAVSAYELEQRLSGAAWEAPLDPNRTLLRVYGLRARGAASAEVPETEAEALGVLWRYNATPTLTLLVEGAQGSLDGVRHDNGEEIDGYGVHLGATGTRGTLSYGFNFRRIDADLVNPANIGLSAGAVPDRIGGDLMLGKTFGTTSVSLQLRTLESGTLADGSGEDVVEDSGTISVFAPIGTKVFLSATSSLTTTQCDADLEHFSPGSDRSLLVVGVTLTESVKGLSFSESLSWQDVSDDLTPAFDSTVTSGTLTAGGALGSSVMLNALLSGTRSESPSPVGVTDLWLASLQPTINWAQTGLSFTPRASFTRVESDLGGTSDSEQYQLIVQWSPAWWRSLVNVQAGADWSRNSVDGLPTPSFDQRIVASLTLRWGLSRALLAAEPPTPLPTVPATSARVASSHRLSFH
ncbi:MAG: hypothetical protein ACSLFQ_15515 [Thermoanaerobaculia bacterium]